MPDEREPISPPDPWELFPGRLALGLPLLAVASLFAGGVIAVGARGLSPDGTLIGYALAGLLILAPLPMAAGDLADAALLNAARRRLLSLEGYRRWGTVLVPGAIAIVGIAIYPVVLAIGGVTLLGVFVVVGAFVLFGVFPVAAWLRRRRSKPNA